MLTMEKQTTRRLKPYIIGLGAFGVVWGLGLIALSFGPVHESQYALAAYKKAYAVFGSISLIISVLAILGGILGFRNKTSDIDLLGIICAIMALIACGIGTFSPAPIWFRDFSHDPINMSMVTGDGSWNSQSRILTVSLKPGEKKPIGFKLTNTSPQNIRVLLQIVGSSDYISYPYSNDDILVPSLKDAEFTITPEARAEAPQGSHLYTIDFGWKSNQKINPINP
jgi:hypothetical protein